MFKARFQSFYDVTKEAVVKAAADASVKADAALTVVKDRAAATLIGGSSIFELEPADLGLFKITDRIYTMGFPTSRPSHIGVLHEQVSAYLKLNHTGRFMVWNLSEKTYDYTAFENNVLEFKFPGYPSAPLDLVFSICDSMHGWLNADEKNVAIVHCQTGNGRTVTLIAAYLSWAGLFQSPDEALQHIAKVRGTDVGSLIIPTQLRYSKYFDSLLHQYKPSIEPIKIERLIMSGIPRFDVNGSVRPYLQIFKNAKLVYTSSKKGEELKWYRPEDHSILFPVGQVLEGDILIRIRHHNSDNNRVSMLRFGFHTGFIEPGNVRFTKEELDGACTSKLFDDDFFLDVIFTKAVDEAGEPIPGSVQPEFWERVTKTKKATASDLNPGFKFTLGDMEEGPEDEVEAKEGKADGAVDHSFQDLANYVKGLEEAEALEEANKSQGVGDIEADLMNELNDMKGNSVAEMEKHLEDFDDADLEHMLGGLDEEEDIEQGLLDALADLDEDDEEDELP